MSKIKQTTKRIKYYIEAILNPQDESEVTEALNQLRNLGEAEITDIEVVDDSE